MGGIVIVADRALIPERADRAVKSAFSTFEAAYNNPKYPIVREENEPSTTVNFFSDLLLKGAVTPTGANILATISAGSRLVLIIPVCDALYWQCSSFDDGIVVYNLRRRYKIKSTGTTMSPTVVLFHELGHAAQRIAWSDYYKNEHKKFMGDNPVRSQAAQIEIERDNLIRHEQPLCTQLGEPVRQNYEDID